MPYRKISRDVKIAAVNLFERNLLPLDAILGCVGFSESTFWRIWKLWNDTGDVVAHKPGTPGRPRLLVHDDLQYLIRLIRHRPCIFLEELQNLLRTNRFVSVHLSTIQRELSRAGISTKRLRKLAKERNEIVRADFLRRMAEYTPDQLGFLDETSKDERTLFRNYGWAREGLRAEMRAPFVRGRRASALGLLALDGMVAYTAREGSFTRQTFIDFLHNQVIPLTTPYPGPLSVLVMDNARIHHGEEMHALAEVFGIRIEYLPPYSPDFNPIEEAFSKIKAFIRRENIAFAAAPAGGLIYDVLNAMDIITPEDAVGYFTHAGYM